MKAILSFTMNKKEEYRIWVMRAISEPNISYNIHYYNVATDRLFSLRHDGQEQVPFCRNWNTVNGSVNPLFQEEIAKIKKLDHHIIQLPRLTVDIKKKFLCQFISQLCDEYSEIKQGLAADLADFSGINHFDFKMSIRNRAPSIYHEYDLQKDHFVNVQVRALFEPLGVSEHSTVIW